MTLYLRKTVIMLHLVLIGFVDLFMSRAVLLKGTRIAVRVTDFANCAPKLNKSLVYITRILRVQSTGDVCCASV